MEILTSLIPIIIFLFVLHALSMSTQGESLFDATIGWFKEIFYFFKNKEWKD